MGATVTAVRPARHLSTAAAAAAAAIWALAARFAANTAGPLASTSGVAPSSFAASERASDPSINASAHARGPTIAAAATTAAATAPAAVAFQLGQRSDDATYASNKIRTADLRERTAEA